MRYLDTRKVTVVGAGVVGLSVAWRAATAGWTVELVDPGVPGHGTSWVAGGMLAPLTEGWPGEERLLALGLASLDRWPAFAGGLDAEVFTAHGTLAVAVGESDAADLGALADWLDQQGSPAQRVSRAEVRHREPGLSRSVRAGLFAASERSVDNRVLVQALVRACEESGVHFVRLPYRTFRSDGQVVLATGVRAPELWPGLPVRPVKGEVLRLRRRPSAPPAPTHTIRGAVHGRHVYLVPRHDGLVVGATQYEAGFDTAVTVAGVRDLLADAETLLPGIGEYELVEALAGLRPVTPDGMPLIGRVSKQVVVACGHGRGGLLLAPLTADAVVALLEGDTVPEAAAADPGRFPPGGA